MIKYNLICRCGETFESWFSSSNEYDIKSLLRQGVNDLTLCNFIKSCYLKKSPGVETMLKTQKIIEHVRPMHTIGG